MTFYVLDNTTNTNITVEVDITLFSNKYKNYEICKSINNPIVYRFCSNNGKQYLYNSKFHSRIKNSTVYRFCSNNRKQYFNNFNFSSRINTSTVYRFCSNNRKQYLYESFEIHNTIRNSTIYKFFNFHNTTNNSIVYKFFNFHNTITSFVYRIFFNNPNYRDCFKNIFYRINNAIVYKFCFNNRKHYLYESFEIHNTIRNSTIYNYFSFHSRINNSIVYIFFNFHNTITSFVYRIFFNNSNYGVRFNDISYNRKQYFYTSFNFLSRINNSTVYNYFHFASRINNPTVYRVCSNNRKRYIHNTSKNFTIYQIDLNNRNKSNTTNDHIISNRKQYFYTSFNFHSRINNPTVYRVCSNRRNKYLCQSLKFHNTTNNIRATSADVENIANLVYIYLNEIDILTYNDSYEVGMVVMKASWYARSLNKSASISVLKLMDFIFDQPFNTLYHSESISQRVIDHTGNYRLWYLKSIPFIVGKTTANFEYSSKSMYIKTMNATNFISNIMFCFDGVASVSSPSTNSNCFVPSANQDYKNVHRLYISLLSVKLYIHDKKDVLNVPIMDPNSTEIITYENIGKCKCQKVVEYPYVIGLQGINNKYEIFDYGSTLTAYHSKTINDLHRKPYIGQIVNYSFYEGLLMSRSSNSYEGTCNASQCVVYFDGCSSDPIECSTALHVTSGVLLGLAIIIAVYFVVLSEVKNATVFFKCMPDWFQKFFISHKDGKLRRFSFLYTATVLIFNSFVFFLGDRSVFPSDDWCEVMAGIHYFLYLSIVFISIENMFILTNIVGGWKPWYGFTIFVLSGLDSHVVRGLYSFLIPFIVTGTFALTMPDFFNRNDDFCWVRTDYRFLSAWLPLIFMGSSLIFYIPLFARCYQRNIVSKYINRWCTTDGEYCDPIAIDGDERKNGNYLTATLISWTLIPQLLLALITVLETTTLYQISLGVGHFIFVIVIYIQITIYYLISFLIVVFFGKPKGNQPRADNFSSTAQRDQQPTTAEDNQESTAENPRRNPSPNLRPSSKERRRLQTINDALESHINIVGEDNTDPTIVEAVKTISNPNSDKRHIDNALRRIDANSVTPNIQNLIYDYFAKRH